MKTIRSYFIKKITKIGVAFPFNPSLFPFYYGWIILIVGSLGVLFSAPGQTVGVSVFTDHLISALRLSRDQISSAYMVGTLLSACLLTRVGRLIDLIGVQVISALAAVFLALAMFGLSRVDHITVFIGTNPLVTAFIIITMGFFSIRFCGQGVLSLASRTMVMRWFEERRGRVAACLSVFVSLGFSYSPRLFQYLVDLSDWRVAWVIIGLALLVIALPVILLFFRDSPERYGIMVEAGLRPFKRTARRQMTQDDRSFTLVQARHETRYWVYTFFLAWWALLGTAFTFHIVDIFLFQSLKATKAVAIFLPISIVSVSSSFLASWISDAIDLSPLFYLATGAMTLVGFTMLFPGTGWSRVTLIGVYGLSSGLWTVLYNIAFPRLFGRTHLGEINGSVMAYIVAGSAVGPWIFSLLRSDEHGYFGAGVFSVCGSLAIGLFGFYVFVLRKKDRR